MTASPTNVRPKVLAFIYAIATAVVATQGLLVLIQALGDLQSLSIDLLAKEPALKAGSIMMLAWIIRHVAHDKLLEEVYRPVRTLRTFNLVVTLVATFLTIVTILAYFTFAVILKLNIWVVYLGYAIILPIIWSWLKEWRYASLAAYTYTGTLFQSLWRGLRTPINFNGVKRLTPLVLAIVTLGLSTAWTKYDDVLRYYIATDAAYRGKYHVK